ncbi:GNAT family N-acetyltransferase [Pelagibacterium halotolerans]|uniref:GNAT family N-acetyltransferase n=1 Tax=Pelagibacterium halotolerans TaxID=531813 RepID=UPI00384DBD75
MKASALLHDASAILPPPLVRAGHFDVRLAVSQTDRDAAHSLRRTVFGLPDADRFDALCDHLLIADRTTGSLAGTARLLPAPATRTDFYAEAEFDVAPLFARHPGLTFCEVGRTCIAPAHRRGAAMHALWAGLAAYARNKGIDVYFGTASFPGADPTRHAKALGFLANTAPAPSGWTVHAHPDRAVPIVPQDRPQAILRRLLPPLLRGYLALGAYISAEAAIDPDFGTTDVLVMTRLANVPVPYRTHFSYSA